MSDISLYMQDPNSEPMLEVDWDTRKCTVPEELYDIAVTNENNAETVYIKVPNSFDGETLGNKSAGIRVQNANNEMYFVDVIMDQESEEGYIILEWTIDSRVTMYAGEILFEVHFNGELYNLHTLPAKLNVLKGLDYISDSEMPEFENKIDEFMMRLSNLELKLNELESKLDAETDKTDEYDEKIANIEQNITTLTDELNYLKQNVVYLNTYTTNINI